MYPLKFNNIYFDKIWGGRDLELFRNNLPEGNIGESWDVSCHTHGISTIANGIFKGMALNDVIKLQGAKLFGNNIDPEWFPLLLKLINSRDTLSVQVHPDDEYALTCEGEMGKTEAWYVLEAFEGASIVLGTKNCSKEIFVKALNDGSFEQYLNNIPVKKGEVYFIKSGLIHAIGAGVIIAEIQQNSDTTYRVYDYNRGRELHIDKAFDVIDFSLKGEVSIGKSADFTSYTKTVYCCCKHFALELYDIHDSFKEISNPERFFIYTCVEGQGKLTYEEGSEVLSLGESILIPAQLGAYEFTGNMKLLKSYVPCIS